MAKRKKPLKKKPSQKETPLDIKSPRGINKAAQIKNERIAWHIRIMDMQGDWGWGEIDKSTLLNEIHLKMSNFETMTWDEILNKNNHEISVSKISRNARKRLVEIQQEDIDQLVSLRLAGSLRVWGIRDRNIFRILWWDPEHTVYPIKKQT